MRKITLKTKGLTSKQYSTLILELNIMAKSWRKYGAAINIQADGAERIINWGTKAYDDIRSESTN